MLVDVFSFHPFNLKYHLFRMNQSVEHNPFFPSNLFEFDWLQPAGRANLDGSKLDLTSIESKVPFAFFTTPSIIANIDSSIMYVYTFLIGYDWLTTDQPLSKKDISKKRFLLFDLAYCRNANKQAQRFFVTSKKKSRSETEVKIEKSDFKAQNISTKTFSRNHWKMVVKNKLWTIRVFKNCKG